jgi:hypothetical protein
MGAQSHGTGAKIGARAPILVPVPRGWASILPRIPPDSAQSRRTGGRLGAQSRGTGSQFFPLILTDCMIENRILAQSNRTRPGSAGLAGLGPIPRDWAQSLLPIPAGLKPVRGTGPLLEAVSRRTGARIGARAPNLAPIPRDWASILL